MSFWVPGFSVIHFGEAVAFLGLRYVEIADMDAVMLLDPALDFFVGGVLCLNVYVVIVVV